MKVFTVTTLAIVLSCGAAIGQTPVPDPLRPDTGARSPGASTGSTSVVQNPTPTAAQCAAGYQTGMNWTREEFVKACAETKDTGK